jgi:hypothetical protein
MFGQGIKRGLTITSDGLTDGYVMFAVPNSASVYLVNRKGEVVHEWKGNYGGPEGSAYLNNADQLHEMLMIQISRCLPVAEKPEDCKKLHGTIK